MDEAIRKQIEQLNDRQLRYIAARLVSKTDAEAYRAAGVSRQAVSKWKKQVDIDGILRALRMEAVEAAAFVFQQNALEAANTVLERMKDDRDALKAALAVLDRIGLPAATEHRISGSLATFSAEDLAQAEREAAAFEQSLLSNDG